MTTSVRPTRAPNAAGSGRLARLGQQCLWGLVIFAAVVVALNVLARLRLVVLPVLLAVVMATVLEPPVRWLRARGWHDGPAAVIVLLISLLVLASALAVIAPPIIDEFGDLDVGVSATLAQVQTWVRDSPLPISNDQISDGIDRLEDQVRTSLDAIAAQLLGGALVALEVLTAVALAIVVLFFLLKDGGRVWTWVLAFIPAGRRGDADRIGARAWRALAGFVRGQTLVALFDAVLIGLALVVIGVPLALPLAVLTFFGAYVPVIGATMTGLLAVLMALVAKGPLAAAAVLAAILLVQQIEGSVFQPVVVGRAIHVHPLAILLGVAAGAVLGGIVGAMVAAPVVAVAGAVLRDIRDEAAVRGDGRRARVSAG